MDNLISRQAAIDAIYETFCYAYCDNCEKEMNEDLCGDCHRKYQNWAASKKIISKTINSLPSAERRGQWTIDAVHQYELAYGATAYEPVYKCSCCGCLTESYLRFDEPIMPDDADFPKWCGNCGARMMNEDD